MAVTLNGSTINMNSGAVVQDPPGTAPCFFERVWLNYNGTGRSIRGSGNISSVTWNSSGNYTLNFATALIDANYGVALANSASTGDANEINVIAPSFGSNPSLMTTTQLQIGGIPDTGFAGVLIVR